MTWAFRRRERSRSVKGNSNVAIRSSFILAHRDKPFLGTFVKAVRGRVPEPKGNSKKTIDEPKRAVSEIESPLMPENKLCNVVDSERQAAVVVIFRAHTQLMCREEACQFGAAVFSLATVIGACTTSGNSQRGETHQPFSQLVDQSSTQQSEVFMRLEVHSSRLNVSERTHSYVNRRLAFALGRFDDVIHNVVVRLEDINGPRGGVDKLCSVRVNLLGQKKPVMAEVLDTSIQASIDMAAERVGRSVARQLNRQADKISGRTPVQISCVE